MGAWEPWTAAKVGGDGMNGPDVAQIMLRDMLEPQEQWNATHAQLLKSVADAQAKLLAAQNETNDRLQLLEKLCNPELEVKALMGISDRLERMDVNLKVLIANTHEAVRNSHGNINARLNEISDRTMALEHVGRALDALSDRVEAVRELLAKPRRQVERIQPKRIVKRAVERKRHA